MLAALERSAAELGLEVETVCTEAERLPFADESFDLVFGHAVLHHIPDLEPRLRRVPRASCGPAARSSSAASPRATATGSRRVPKRAGHLVAAPAWRRLVGAARAGWVDRRPEPRTATSSSPRWTCTRSRPADLRAFADDAGFERVRLRGEELVANAYGWWLRTLEATAEPDEVPLRWRHFAFRSYIALQRVDTALLEPRLPPELFYNLVLSARKPAEDGGRRARRARRGWSALVGRPRSATARLPVGRRTLSDTRPT